MGALKILKILDSGVIEKIVDRPLDIIGRQLEFCQMRKNKKLEQELRQDEAKFHQELELENRKRNAELDAFISEKEIERNAKIAESITNYQSVMAECSVSIGKSLGIMGIELRERAHALIMEKKEQYLQLQHDATEKSMNQLENIRNKFPEGSKARDIMETAVEKQILDIIDTSSRFIRRIDEDFVRMTENIEQITKQTITNASQYISPTFAKAMANGSTEENFEVKLLKS